MKNEGKKEEILIQKIKQSNKILKNILNIIILSGSLGFLIISISSYLNKNLIEFLDASKIIFYPQGLTMMIYGLLGVILSINQILTIQLRIGEGWNEINKKTNTIKIVRKNSHFENLELSYSLDDIVRDINVKTII